MLLSFALLNCHLIAIALPPRLVPMLVFVLLIVLLMLSILNRTFLLCTKHGFLQYIAGIGKHHRVKPIGHIRLKDKI